MKSRVFLLIKVSMAFRFQFYNRSLRTYLGNPGRLCNGRQFPADIDWRMDSQYARPIFFKDPIECMLLRSLGNSIILMCEDLSGEIRVVTFGCGPSELAPQRFPEQALIQRQGPLCHPLKGPAS